MGQRAKDGECIRQHPAAYPGIRLNAAITTFICQPRLQLWVTSECWMAERLGPELIVNGLPHGSVGSALGCFIVQGTASRSQAGREPRAESAGTEQRVHPGKRDSDRIALVRRPPQEVGHGRDLCVLQSA